MSKINSYVFPAGRYYVGDLCYVKKLSDTWNEKGGYGEATDDFEDVNGFFQVSNPNVVVWSNNTAYGDGYFDSNKGLKFPVDAGLIGVCPLSEDEEYYGGHIIEFNEPFSPYYNEGTFFIGELVIYTADEDEDYYGEDEDENEDYYEEDEDY